MNFQEIIQRTKLQYNDARQKQCENRLNLFLDNGKGLIDEELQKQFHPDSYSRIKLMIDDSDNIYKRILTDLSTVYEEDASRKYITGYNEEEKTDIEDERYSEILENIPTDLIMQRCNEFTNVCNTTALYIVPRNDLIEYDLITIDKIEVIQNILDPTQIDAVIITQNCVDTVDNCDIRKVYWDVYGNHKLLDGDDQVKEDYGNPYTIDDPTEYQIKQGITTIIPFVFIQKNYQIDCIFDETSGQDLYNGTIIIGVLLTYLNYLIKVSSFKQVVYGGINMTNMNKDLLFDPLTIINHENSDGKVYTVDLQAEFEKIMDVINTKISMIANNYGLSMDNFKLTGSVESGFALTIKNLPLQKINRKQRKTYRYAEQEIFKKTKTVNNKTYKTKLIAEDGKFIIDFAEVDQIETPEENRKQWIFDIEIGARTPLDYIMSINPDIKTNKEALVFLESNKAINDQFKADTGINFADLLKETNETLGANNENQNQ